MSILNSICNEEREDDRRDNNNRNNNYNNNNRNNNYNNRNNNRDDNRRDNNRDDNRNNNYNNRNNNRDDNRRDNNRDDNRSNFSCKLAKYFNRRRDRVDSPGVSSKDIRREVLDNNGLLDLINDLKHWKKKGGRKPEYAITAVWDISFASCLNKGIDKLLKSKEIKEKELMPLFDEMVLFIGKVDKSEAARDSINHETINDMKSIYTSILVKFSEKKIKKFKKKVSGLTIEIAEKLAVATLSKNPKTSMVQTLRIIYDLAKEGCEVEITEDNLFGLLKVCYGKKNNVEILKYIMLEPYNKNYYTDGDALFIWNSIDKMYKTELNKLSIKEIKKVVSDFASERFNQERNGYTNRRLGDRNKIDKEEYPRLVKAFEEVELDDITLKKYFRYNKHQ